MRQSKAGLTILESLVLLIAAILLALVAVPVVLAKLDIIKPDALPELKTPPAEQAKEPKAIPLPQLSLPGAPKLPPPADSTKP